MGRKVKKSVNKPKLVRSSSIEKTIDEGKDYINRADRRLRSRNKISKSVIALPNKTKIQKNKNQPKRKP